MNFICKSILVAAFATAIAFPQFVPSNPNKPAPVVAPVVTPDPTVALAKYRACIAPNPTANISLKDAREVKAKLAADGFDVRGGLFCNELQSGPVGARAVPEEELVRAGFPEDKPLNLTIKGSNDHHSVAAIKKQMDYGWGYWTFFGKWVVRMWW